MADSTSEPAKAKSPEATATKETSETTSTTEQNNLPGDDSDPDFDDLDDVLDQFSANAPSKQNQSATTIPTASGPGRPEDNKSTPTSQAQSQAPFQPQVPAGPQPNETEDEFIARLSAEMSSMLSSLGNDPANSAATPEDIAKMGADLEAFTHKMEAEGIKPEDLLKAILGEEEGAKLAESARQEAKADAAGPGGSSNKASESTSSGQIPNTTSTAKTASTSTTTTGTTTFEDTIRRTMSRLDQSNTEATNATAKSTTKSEEDMLAELLKAMEAGGEGNEGGMGEDSLSKMFLDMMQQLTHKEMLYEPMKELQTQYPSWLASHKPPKLPESEYDRYTRQNAIVADIVRKFEEPNFSDDDPQCREFVWEKMQLMQGEGAPPEELVKNPFPGTDFGGIPGLGGGGEGGGIGGMGEKELEDGCPTQ